MFEYLLKILGYLAFIIIVYVVAIYSYCKNYKTITVHSYKTSYRNGSKNKKRMGLLAITFLSVLIGIYSIISSKYPYSSDRGNYALRFANQWDAPWTVGLNLLADFLQLFTSEPKVLFFTVSFLCLFITLIAYNMFEEAEPRALLLMVMSNYCIYSFYLFKQAPSIAFATVSIAALFNKKRLLSILFLIIAISFHEAAYILIPLYIVLRGAKKRWVRGLLYVVLVLSVIFFSSASRMVSGFIGQWIPNLAEQFSGYIDDSGGIVQDINIFTIFKGFPYYFTTFYATWKRPLLKDKIKNYDRFLVLCAFASVINIMSIYMYWMWRFATYCYFPMFIFVSLILRVDKGRDKQIFYLMTGSSLFVITFRYLFQIYLWHGGF